MEGGQTFVLIQAVGIVIVINVIEAAIRCFRRRPAKNLKIDSRESTQERAVPQAKWAEADEVKSPREKNRMNDTAEATAADRLVNTMCEDVKDELKSMTQAIMDKFCKIESDVNELKANVSNILERPVLRAEWTDLQDLVKSQGAQNIPADEILQITADKIVHVTAGEILQVTAGDIVRQGKNNSRAHVVDDIKSNKMEPMRPWPHKFKNNLFLRYWKPKLLRCMVTGLELPWNQVIGAHIIPKSQAAILRELGMDGDAVAN